MQTVIDALKPIAKAVVGAAVPILIVAAQDIVASGANWTLAAITSFLTGLSVWAKRNG